jgi:ABC-type lipoprotein release transport system permease subunit
VWHLLEVAQTGLAAAALHPLRSVVCVAAAVAALTPYIVGLALAKGVQEEAMDAVRFGPDLLVRGVQFGRAAPLPLSAVKAVADIDGVDSVVPRIVGEVSLGRDRIRCVLVGMPPASFPRWVNCVEGSLPSGGRMSQLVLGSALARRLGLKVGSRIPPFYRNSRAERLSEVVGIFDPAAPLWQGQMVFTTLQTAAEVFDQPGLVTDLLVTCKHHRAEDVAREIDAALSFRTEDGVVRAEVTSSEDVTALLARGPRHDEGVFNLHFALAFVVAILVLLVTSGAGMEGRRREVGILKATGWQTDEVMLRACVESLALAITGACLAFLLAWAWLRLLGGWGLAGIFMPGIDPEARMPVPFRLTPVPLLLGFILSLVVVLTGTLFSTWRAAVTPPREAMR